jgi:hypothetical protein
MGKIKDFGGSGTNKPQGGWRAPARPFDAKQAAAAMQAGNFDGVIQLLVAQTPADSIHTAQGHSALMACITHDAVPVAQRLLNAGSHPDRNPLGHQDSTYVGCVLRRMNPGFNQPMLRLLLSMSASPSLPICSRGPTPLAYAAQHALAGPAYILSHEGADPFAIDSSQEGGGLCPLDHVLMLPTFQKALMLLTLFPPPLSMKTTQRLLAHPGSANDSTIAWLAG